MVSWYVAHVFSKCLWNSTSCPYYYWYYYYYYYYYYYTSYWLSKNVSCLRLYISYFVKFYFRKPSIEVRFESSINQYTYFVRRRLVARGLFIFVPRVVLYVCMYISLRLNRRLTRHALYSKLALFLPDYTVAADRWKHLSKAYVQRHSNLPVCLLYESNLLQLPVTPDFLVI